MLSPNPRDRDVRPGFIGCVDPRSARRQLRMSLAMTAVLALAIGGAATALRPLPGFDVASQRAHMTDLAAVTHDPVNASLQTGLRDGC